MSEESTSTVPSIWASIFSWCTPTVFFVFLNLVIGTIFVTSNFGSNKSGNIEPRKQQESTRRLARSPSVLQRLKSMNFCNYSSQEPNTAFEKSPHLDVDSHFSFQQTPESEKKQGAFLSRSPSMLQRLKSINLHGYFSQEPTSNFSLKTPEPDTHYPPPAQTHEQDQPQFEEEEKEEMEEEDEREQLQEQNLDEVYSKLKQNHVTRAKSETKPASGEMPTELPSKMRKSASTRSAFSHFEEEDIVESRRPATMREGKVSEEVDDEVDAKADDFINRFKNQLKLQRIDSIIRSKERIRGGSAK